MPSSTPYSSNSSVTPSPTYRHDRYRRPASIAELAQAAEQASFWDPSKNIKVYLRKAQNYRADGQAYAEEGDLERAFIVYAKAAKMVLERIPTHRDYKTALNAEQRHYLGLNGEGILSSLSDLKPTLVDRYERWIRDHPNEDPGPNPRLPDTTPSPSTDNYPANPNSRPLESNYASNGANKPPERSARAQEDERLRREQSQRQRKLAEDAQRHSTGVAQSRSSSVQPQRSQESQRRPPREVPDEYASTQRAAPAVSAARQAADQYQEEKRRAEDARWRADETNRRADDALRREEDVRRRDEAARRQQEEMKRREEEIKHARLEEKRRQEQDGILRRQQEAETAARQARQTPVSQPSITMPVPSTTPHRPIAAPTPMTKVGQQFLSPSRMPDEQPGPLALPLESPTRSQPTPNRGVPAIKYPKPVTTTSPPPPTLNGIQYPDLMTKHQMKQGYTPSLGSMFASLSKPMPGQANLLFLPDSKPATRSLYPAEAMPRASEPIGGSAYNAHGMPAPHNHHHHHNYHHYSSSSDASSYAGPTRPAPPIPPSSVPPEARIIPASDPRARGTESKQELKHVHLPLSCLPRFQQIAALNTAQNRETCGLLLGKDRGDVYGVTTLLVPKQHSTSDTCTMDEEELVLEFTEKRSLITLGWIHTHPTQSCFMSSVDLHTHSAFQCMLPESFAVVCAPKSEPAYGIFRLTNPPGLQTILNCGAKEAFHPHPDLPIYTDADKGHVFMKDLNLEIVDLR